MTTKGYIPKAARLYVEDHRPLALCHDTDWTDAQMREHAKVGDVIAVLLYPVEFEKMEARVYHCWYAEDGLYYIITAREAVALLNVPAADRLAWWASNPDEVKPSESYAAYAMPAMHF